MIRLSALNDVMVLSPDRRGRRSSSSRGRARRPSSLNDVEDMVLSATVLYGRTLGEKMGGATEVEVLSIRQGEGDASREKGTNVGVRGYIFCAGPIILGGWGFFRGTR